MFNSTITIVLAGVCFQVTKLFVFFINFSTRVNTRLEYTGIRTYIRNVNDGFVFRIKNDHVSYQVRITGMFSTTSEPSDIMNIRCTYFYDRELVLFYQLELFFVIMMYGSFSGVLAFISLCLHIYYLRRGLSDSNNSSILLRVLLAIGCIGQLAGVCGFIVYLVLGITTHQGKYKIIWTLSKTFKKSSTLKLVIEVLLTTKIIIYTL